MPMIDFNSLDEVLQKNLSAIHMSQNTYFEPQRTNHFQATFFNLPAPSGKSSTQVVRELTLSVLSYSLPTVSTDPLEVAHGNTNVKFAGSATYTGADSLVCIDYLGVDIEAIIEAWHQQVFNPYTGQIGFAADYKKEGEVIEFAPDGSNSEVRVWEIHGAWPSSVAYGDALDYSSVDTKKITTTITYDYAYRRH